MSVSTTPTIDEIQVIEDLVAIIDNLVDAWEIKLIPQDYIIVDRARSLVAEHEKGLGD